MDYSIENPSKSLPTARRFGLALVVDLLLLALMVLGAYFRFEGSNWGEYSYMHPDERFLVMVGADIQPVESVDEYFDTANSTLNPHNRGHAFYVYGTLPLFLDRYLAQAQVNAAAREEAIQAGQEPPDQPAFVGLANVLDIGRPLSALFDLLVIPLVYLAASRLYGRRVGLLSAAFYAAAVLPIQLSHFFKEDTFTNFFNFLAIYFAVRIVTSAWPHARAAYSITPYSARRIAAGAESYAVPDPVGLHRRPNLE